jgi:hypothetical protein
MYLGSMHTRLHSGDIRSQGTSCVHHNIITNNSWHIQGPLLENNHGYKHLQFQHYNVDLWHPGKTVEVTSTEEKTQHAEQDFCFSHTASFFHQLKLSEDKINFHSSCLFGIFLTIN